MIEVEFKFPVDSLSAVRKQVEQLTARQVGTVNQEDEYFNHPNIDFERLDLALRFRRGGDQQWLTYKGANEDDSGIGAAKIRTEIDLELPTPQFALEMRKILIGCGFTAVATIHKRRETFRLEMEAGTIDICLDDVDGLGQFVELEWLVAEEIDPENGEIDTRTAKSALRQLADKLNLANPVTATYLELKLSGKTDRT